MSACVASTCTAAISSGNSDTILAALRLLCALPREVLAVGMPGVLDTIHAFFGRGDDLPSFALLAVLFEGISVLHHTAPRGTGSVQAKDAHLHVRVVLRSLARLPSLAALETDAAAIVTMLRHARSVACGVARRMLRAKSLPPFKGWLTVLRQAVKWAGGVTAPTGEAETCGNLPKCVSGDSSPVPLASPEALDAVRGYIVSVTAGVMHVLRPPTAGGRSKTRQTAQASASRAKVLEWKPVVKLASALTQAVDAINASTTIVAPSKCLVVGATFEVSPRAVVGDGDGDGDGDVDMDMAGTGDSDDRDQAKADEGHGDTPSYHWTRALAFVRTCSQMSGHMAVHAVQGAVRALSSHSAKVAAARKSRTARAGASDDAAAAAASSSSSSVCATDADTDTDTDTARELGLAVIDTLVDGFHVGHTDTHVQWSHAWSTLARLAVACLDGDGLVTAQTALVAKLQRVSGQVALKELSATRALASALVGLRIVETEMLQAAGYGGRDHSKQSTRQLSQGVLGVASLAISMASRCSREAQDSGVATMVVRACVCVCVCGCGCVCVWLVGWKGKTKTWPASTERNLLLLL